MCGRSRCSLAPEQVAKAVGLPKDAAFKDADKYAPSFNVSPGFWTPILKNAEDGGRELQTMKWGLVPSFTKHGQKLDHFKMFNARCETVSSKSIFSRLLSRHRCVVIFNGFYEWKKEGSSKQPHYLSFGEDDVVFMAALYDVYTDEAGNPLYTYTILTTDSSSTLSWLHSRMPVILRGAEEVSAWLDPGVTKEDIEKLLAKVCKPYEGKDLLWHPVTPAMGKIGYQGPECCEDINKKPAPKGGIRSFFAPKSTSSPSEKEDTKDTKPITSFFKPGATPKDEKEGKVQGGEGSIDLTAADSSELEKVKEEKGDVPEDADAGFGRQVKEESKSHGKVESEVQESEMGAIGEIKKEVDRGLNPDQEPGKLGSLEEPGAYEDGKEVRGAVKEGTDLGLIPDQEPGRLSVDQEVDKVGTDQGGGERQGADEGPGPSRVDEQGEESAEQSGDTGAGSGRVLRGQTKRSAAAEGKKQPRGAEGKKATAEPAKKKGRKR